MDGLILLTDRNFSIIPRLIDDLSGFSIRTAVLREPSAFWWNEGC